MSDERDETRRAVPPSIDPTDAPAPGAGPGSRSPAGRDDGTRVGGSPGDSGTRVSGSPGDSGTWAGDQTAPLPAVGEPAADGDAPAGDQTAPLRGVTDTLADGPAAGARRPDATSVLPAVDDWAASRANPAWSGRAEVRAPVRPETDDWTAPGEPQSRWWMPIVVGGVVLVLLAALAWGIYVIVQNLSRDDEAPAPATSATATVAPTGTTASTPSSTPSAEPTTTAPTTPPTTNPTIVEVTIPALRGLSLPEAQAALSRRGLSYRLIYRADRAAPDTVIDCDPTEGQEVPPDTVITLVVARSEATPTATATGSTTGAGVNRD